MERAEHLEYARAFVRAARKLLQRADIVKPEQRLELCRRANILYGKAQEQIDLGGFPEMTEEVRDIFLEINLKRAFISSKMAESIQQEMSELAIDRPIPNDFLDYVSFVSPGLNFLNFQ